MRETTEAAAPLVSVVCVTHNRRDLVLRCLDSCAAQDYPRMETIVVVNGCTDDTAEAIAKQHPGARLLETAQNIGFFPALNLAIRNAQGEYVLTLDDDAHLLGTDAVAQFVAAFVREPELGAATCNIEGPAEEPPVAADRYVATFKTGFTMMPRKVFTEWVGYYPDLFFRSGGEYYLCTALWDGGRRVKQLSGIRMRHDRAMTG
ncbi:MAG: glycosyltransferase family 2 protein, partial [Phycisphaerae bacterium]|nr:glycosyltransferase family 2 protein [Phycisphaerae bacterium]